MNKLDQQIQSALDVFNYDDARKLLRKALKNPSADTYYLASQLAIDEGQKERFLKKALELQPSHLEAQRELSKIKGSEIPRVNSSNSQVTFKSDSKKESDLSASTYSQFVVCEVAGKSSVPLSKLPLPAASTRTMLKADTSLALIARTESGKWLNVMYFGSANNPILGWIEVDKVTKPHLRTQPVLVSDLPITNFDYSTREDLVDLISLLQKGNYLNFLVMIGGLVMLILGCGWVALFNASGDSSLSRSGNGFFLIFAIIGLVMFLAGWSRTRSAEKQSQLNLGWSLSSALGKLDYIRRSKQPASENEMEHQARMQANQLAGNLIVKMTPEFKDIVAITKPK